mmetsp:Transcript_27518/g.55390  ORF Transcript_27518/g.55390 Transcript_27518/m.55390 type:complete len:1186 (-) Transcript_27518:214-3771(-)
MLRYQRLVINLFLLVGECRALVASRMQGGFLGSRVRLLSTTNECCPDQLSKLSVVQLKQRCRELGLPISGRKALLVERLATSELIGDAAPIVTDEVLDVFSELNNPGETSLGAMVVTDEAYESDTIVLFRLPPNTSEEELRQSFAWAGEAGGATPFNKIFVPKSGRLVGRAYISFDDPKTARRALSRGVKSPNCTDLELSFQDTTILARMSSLARLEKDMEKAAKADPVPKNARILLKQACDRRKSAGLWDDALLSFTTTATVMRDTRDDGRLVKIFQRGFAPSDGSPDLGFTISAFKVECVASGVTAVAEASSIKAANEVAAARVLVMLIKENAVDFETLEEYEASNIPTGLVDGEAYDNKLAIFIREKGEKVIKIKTPPTDLNDNSQMESDSNRDFGFVDTFEEMDEVLNKRLAQAHRAIGLIRKIELSSQDQNGKTQDNDDCDTDDWSTITSLEEVAGRVSAHFSLAFTLLGRRFANQQMADISLRWIRQLRSLELSPRFPNNEIVSSCLKAASNIGEYRAVDKILGGLEYIDPTFINYLTTAYLRANKPLAACELVLKAGMETRFGITPNSAHVNTLLISRRLTDEIFQDAIENDLPRLGLKLQKEWLDSYMKLTLSRKSDPDKVISIFRTILLDETLTVSTDLWTGYINALGLKGDLEDAREVIDNKIPRKELKVAHLNTLMSALGRNSRPLEAYDLFMELPEKYGMHYDTLSFTNAIHAVTVDGANIEQAEEIFNLMNSTEHREEFTHRWSNLNMFGTPPPEGGWRPDKVTIGALVQANLRANNFDRVDDILSWVRSSGETITLFTVKRLLAAWGAAGDWRKAVEFLEREMTGSFFLSKGDQVDVMVLNSGLVACARSGELTEALRLFKMFEEQVGYGLSPYMEADTYTHNTLLNAVANSPDGTWRDGLRVLKGMLERKVSPTSFTMNSFMACCEKDGASEGACETAVRVLSDMRKGLYDGVKPDIISYNVAIAACRERGLWGTAKSIFEQIKSDGIAPDLITYNSLIAVGVKSAGIGADAIKVFEELFDNVDVAPNSVSYECLLDILGSLPDFEEEAIRYYARSHLAGNHQHFHEDRFLVDLHGCSQVRATLALRVVLDYLGATKNMQTLIRDQLIVVTGKGLRSKTDLVLGPVARTFLTNPDMFFPPLQIRDFPGNAGRFVITRDSLLSWAMAKKNP